MVIVVDHWIGELEILKDGLVIPPRGLDRIVPQVIWLSLPLLHGVIGQYPRLWPGRVTGIIELLPRVLLGRLMIEVIGRQRRNLDRRKVIFLPSPGMVIEESLVHECAPHAMEHAAEPLTTSSLGWLKLISCLRRHRLLM